jgi:hypothetical protein
MNVGPQTPEDASPVPELDADIARLTRLRESPPDGATRGYAELTAGSSSRDRAAVLLAAVTLDRFRARQAAGGDDRERARRELDEAVASLEPLVATGASAAVELAVVRGAVRLQQAEVSGRRDDLDHGITELETGRCWTGRSMWTRWCSPRGRFLRHHRGATGNLRRSAA